jgi:hypothetical protein
MSPQRRKTAGCPLHPHVPIYPHRLCLSSRARRSSTVRGRPSASRGRSRAHTTRAVDQTDFFGRHARGQVSSAPVTEAKGVSRPRGPRRRGLWSAVCAPLGAQRRRAQAAACVRSACAVRTRSALSPLTPLDLLPKAELFASFNNPPSTPVSKPTILPRSMVASVGATERRRSPTACRSRASIWDLTPLRSRSSPRRRSCLGRSLLLRLRKRRSRTEEEMEEEQEEGAREEQGA